MIKKVAYPFFILLISCSPALQTVVVECLNESAPENTPMNFYSVGTNGSLIANNSSNTNALHVAQIQMSIQPEGTLYCIQQPPENAASVNVCNQSTPAAGMNVPSKPGPLVRLDAQINQQQYCQGILNAIYLAGVTPATS